MAFSRLDVMAESTCDYNPFNIMHVQSNVLEKNVAPGVDGRLGPHQIIDIELGEHDILSRAESTA